MSELKLQKEVLIYGEAGHSWNIRKKDVYVLTPEELLELRKKWAEEDWRAGLLNGFNNGKFGHSKGEPSKEQYINNLTIE